MANPLARRARQLQNQGVMHGKPWGRLIHRIGFDPRTFVNGTMTIGTDPHGRLQRGRGVLKPFTPFKAPTSPPPGTYDPALDAAERAAGRGYLDLQQDTERDRGRLYSGMFDPSLGTIPNLQRQRGEEEQDYGRQVGDLSRQFERLGIGQTMAARASGVDEGGALVQALAKRRANEAYARVPIDTAHTRFQGENDRQQQQANLEYQRANEDLSTNLLRAGRENTFFGQDTARQRFFQAEQSGADLPSKPANERTKNGLTFRVGGMNKPLSQRTYRLETGQQLGRGAFVKLMRRRRGAA